MFWQKQLLSIRQILVVGDFDCDGATSSALAVLALRGMGGRGRLSGA